MNVACSFVSQFFSLVTREGQTSTVGGDDMAPSLLIILRAVNNLIIIQLFYFTPDLVISVARSLSSNHVLNKRKNVSANI